MLPSQLCTAASQTPHATKAARSSARRYPWWPSLILERTDSRIPPQERRNTQTATPVLFFGTAEFSWIDASRNVSPWETEWDARSTKDDSADFELVRRRDRWGKALTWPRACATQHGLPACPFQGPVSRRLWQSKC